MAEESNVKRLTEDERIRLELLAARTARVKAEINAANKMIDNKRLTKENLQLKAANLTQDIKLSQLSVENMQRRLEKSTEEYDAYASKLKEKYDIREGWGVTEAGEIMEVGE